MAFLLAALFMVAAAILLVFAVTQQNLRRRQVEQRLQGHMERDNAMGGWLRMLGESRFGQRSLKLDSEAQTLLNRVGWRRAGQRSLYAASQLGFPVVAFVLTLIVQSAFDNISYPWMAPMFAIGVGYLLPKRLLAIWAGKRQERIAQEVSTFIPLLRVLFESGLAIEQALRVLAEQAEKLLPILTSELRVVLVRVDSGLELGEELGKSAALLDVEEYTDTCVILQQLIYQGGGAMKSLLALKQLFDDRRMSGLQEYISKMSAKMSIVMMVFLFPALLIVLAGPGFSAIARSIGSGF